jgi:hypothetical protein
MISSEGERARRLALSAWTRPLKRAARRRKREVRVSGSDRAEGDFEIGDQIAGVLDAEGEANE